MSFPLAHPAAVLPFRSYCPRFLSFPALVWGSLTPDLGYFFEGTALEDLSHTLLGSIGFCLPVGLLTFGLCYFLALVLAKHLPVLRPLLQRPASLSAAIIFSLIISLLIGIWTHLLLDSVTHTHGWATEHWPVLQSAIIQVYGRKVRLCHLIWYGSSFAGVAWLYWAFLEWKETKMPQVVSRSGRSRLLEATLVASSVVPIELAHHLVRGIIGPILVATLSLALVVGVLIRCRPRQLDSVRGKASLPG